jgi:hypothetical protein
MIKDLETVASGKKAFQIHQDVLILKKRMGTSFVEMGRLLKLIRDCGYYKTLGYDDFQSYIINSELGFKRRTAYYYIEIYEWYVVKFKYETEKLADLGYDKLVTLLPIIKKDELNAKNLIKDAEVLRPVDFNKKYKDEEKQEGHEGYLAPPEYFRCECHGKWKIVVPIEDCCEGWLKEFRERLNRKYGQK